MQMSFPCLNVCVRALASPFLYACLLLAAAPCHANAPANDNLANAQGIPPGASFSVSGTEVGASQEAFEEASDYPLSFVDEESGSMETVWYTWTPTVSGALTARIGYPMYSPILGFFKVPTPNSASFVTDSGVEAPTTGPANVVAGQQYLIVVAIPTGLANTFNIAATVTPAATPGKVFVTLSSAPASDLTVTYKIGGTAVNGTDYKMLKGSVTIPAGQTSAEIKVKPLAGGSGPVSVKLSLTSGDGYTLGSPVAGKVKIAGGR